ncbi:MAG: hypothetical protein JNM56_22955, partial [Planctomycetia bacterium]|nr:hypothetical protein [Planctomycetia bacterium]
MLRAIRNLLLSTVAARSAAVARVSFHRYVPTIESLEERNLLATLIGLNGAGAGADAGTLTDPAIPDRFEFKATVTGKISILMRAEQELMLSELSVADEPSAIGFAVASQVPGALDYFVQFDVTADQTYEFTAGVPYDPSNPGRRLDVGAYRLYLSTEASDFSAVTPHMIPLDASGLGIQLGTLETAGDQDLFAFTAKAKGRAFVRVDGGANAGQELVFDTVPGQTIGILVSRDSAGPYVLTVNAFADDFPDAGVKTVKLDADGTGSQSGRIDYIGDVDVFRFTATKSGTMTVTMEDDEWRFTGDLTVSSPDISYQFSGPPNPFLAYPRIVQFEVKDGVTYTVRASGVVANDPVESHSANYELSFSMVKDDFADSKAHLINIDEVTHVGTQSGSIESPGDTDRFSFTAAKDGYAIIALTPTFATNMQGLLTVPTAPRAAITVVDQSDSSVTVVEGDDVFVHFGHGGTTRGHFVVLRVTAGDTYEFLVSADQGTIGSYTVSLAAFDTADTATFKRLDFSGQGFFEDTLAFALPTPADSAPSPEVVLTITTSGFVFPVPERGTPSVTNTQLAAFPLPGANGGGSPVNPVSLTANSLIATLLGVAARDNAVPPADQQVLAARGNSELASSLLVSLLTGVVSSGGSDAAAAPVISGTVFADVDANGRPGEEEPGVAGEQVVLEVLQNGQYVVVATATTDANGAYAFEAVPAGEYRVRRVTEGTAGKANGQTIKITGDGK